MRVHEVGVRIATQYPQIQVRTALGQPRDDGHGIHGIATPVLAQDEEVPSPGQRGDTLDIGVVHSRVPPHGRPQLEVLLRRGEHGLELERGLVAGAHRSGGTRALERWGSHAP